MPVIDTSQPRHYLGTVRDFCVSTSTFWAEVWGRHRDENMRLARMMSTPEGIREMVQLARQANRFRIDALQRARASR